MNSEPAFPHSYKIPEPERPLTIGDTQTVHGLSMRDWFAGQALAGMLMTGSANIDLIINGKTQKYNIPQAAFAIADAMLEARKENHDTRRSSS